MNLSPYLLLFLVFLAPPLSIYLSYRLQERRAERIIAQLPANPTATYQNIKIWFKRYDMTLWYKNKGINPYKPLYACNIVDLYLFSEGLVVVGKVQQFGKLRKLTPFVICPSYQSTLPAVVSNPVLFTGLELQGQDLDISFKDADYTNTIKLAVKTIGADLYDKMHTLGY